MVFYHAELPLAESSRDRALEMITKLVERSREEDGVIEYHAAVDVIDPTLVRLIEEFEDEAAFQRHQETQHVQEFEDELPDLLSQNPRIIRLDIDDKSTRTG